MNHGIEKGDSEWKMNIINKDEVIMSVTEALEFCIEKKVEGSHERLESYIRNNKLATNQKVALQNELERFYENVEITGGGKRGEVILSEPKDKPTEREFNYKGTVSTDNQELMAEIIFNQLLKQKDNIYKYETGLSYSGWANLCGIYNNPNTEEFKEELIGVIQELHEFSDMKSFKPSEVVDEFMKAIERARKASPKNAFNNLRRKGKIKTEKFNIKAVPLDESEVVVNDEYEEQEVGLKYVVISDEEYKAMKQAREEVLSALNVSLTEYNDNIGKKNRTANMNRAFREVKKRLKDEFNAVFMFESIKVEIIDPAQEPNIYFDDVNGCFFIHFQKLVRDRQNRKDYKTSTYFWKRFYLLNTFAILEYIGFSNGIDYEMYKEARTNYLMDMLTYRYDFVGYEAEKEIFEGVGVFGDFATIIKEKQDEWLSNYLSNNNDEPKEAVVDKEVVSEYECENTIHHQLIERFNSEQLSDFARYVNDELGDFFDWDKKESNPLGIEPVSGITDSKLMINENLTSSSISQLDLVSTEKVENIKLSQKERDELNWCLLEMEFAFTQLHDVRLSA